MVKFLKYLFEAGPLYAPSLIFSLIFIFIRWPPKPVLVCREFTLTNSLADIEQHQLIDALVHLGLQKVVSAILLLVDHFEKVVILAREGCGVGKRKTLPARFWLPLILTMSAQYYLVACVILSCLLQ